MINQIGEALSDRKDLLDRFKEQQIIRVQNNKKITVKQLMSWLSGLCKIAEKPMVILIDNVDSAVFNYVFLDFLSVLRADYNNRYRNATFQSVIFVGVKDIRNIKSETDEVVMQKEGFEDSTTVWSRNGIDEAVKLILNSKAPLFESMTRQLYEHQDMKQMLQQILLQGRRLPYNALNDLATMLGYIENRNGIVQVANRIFEAYLCNLFSIEHIDKSGTDI